MPFKGFCVYLVRAISMMRLDMLHAELLNTSAEGIRKCRAIEALSPLMEAEN